MSAPWWSSWSSSSRASSWWCSWSCVVLVLVVVVVVVGRRSRDLADEIVRQVTEELAQVVERIAVELAIDGDAVDDLAGAGIDDPDLAGHAAVVPGQLALDTHRGRESLVADGGVGIEAAVGLELELAGSRLDHLGVRADPPGATVMGRVEDPGEQAVTDRADRAAIGHRDAAHRVDGAATAHGGGDARGCRGAAAQRGRRARPASPGADRGRGCECRVDEEHAARSTPGAPHGDVRGGREEHAGCGPQYDLPLARDRHRVEHLERVGRDDGDLTDRPGRRRPARERDGDGATPARGARERGRDEQEPERQGEPDGDALAGLHCADATTGDGAWSRQMLAAGTWQLPQSYLTPRRQDVGGGRAVARSSALGRLRGHASNAVTRCASARRSVRSMYAARRSCPAGLPDRPSACPTIEDG